MQTQEKSAADHIDALLAVLKGAAPDKQLTIVGAIIETLRLVAEAVPVNKRKSALAAALATANALSSTPIDKVKFSLLRAVKSEDLSQHFDCWFEAGQQDLPENRAIVRLSAIKLFMNVLEIEPDAASVDLLSELLKEEAENFFKPQSVVPVAPVVPVVPPPPVAKAVVTPHVPRFEINQPNTVLRTFKPAPFVFDERKPQLHIVDYKGELPGGGLGPSMWGVCYTDEESGSSHVLLETGEYIVVPSHSLTLCQAGSYADVPPYLLACAHLFMPLLLCRLDKMSDTPASVTSMQARFGEFTKPLYFHQAMAQNVFSLTGVIESAKWQFSGTAPVGASAKFPVPELASIGAYVMVVAESAAVRPYVYANLITKDDAWEKEKIVMRLDRPREFSALGVYLFPLADSAVALVVPPA